jgi:cytosine/creatinine deaminase
MREIYSGRYAALMEAARKYLADALEIRNVHCGLYTAAELKNGMSSGQAEAAATAAGVETLSRERCALEERPEVGPRLIGDARIAALAAALYCQIAGSTAMPTLITRDTPVSDEALNAIAHMPTRSLPALVEDAFLEKLTDADFMRIAVLLAQKGYDEGGCPIGGVIIDNQTRRILGKGHNTLVQESHPYNHGETSAIRDAGRQDFSLTTIFTTLSPCDVCATLIYMRAFSRVVVGDVTNASGNEPMLRDKGVRVDILQDQAGIQLYARYRAEKPAQDLEDWKGLAAVRAQAAASQS